jgi:hypothetical protein
MKKGLIITVVLVVFLLLLAGSVSCSSDTIKASFGEEFALPLGKTAAVGDDNLTFMFVDVISDSRCPSGVECIQAGEAKCSMHIVYHGAASDVIFIQGGGNTPSFGELNSYDVMYKLEPYPEAGKEIAKSDYMLKITVKK